MPRQDIFHIRFCIVNKNPMCTIMINLLRNKKEGSRFIDLEPMNIFDKQYSKVTSLKSVGQIFQVLNNLSCYLFLFSSWITCRFETESTSYQCIIYCMLNLWILKSHQYIQWTRLTSKQCCPVGPNFQILFLILSYIIICTKKWRWWCNIISSPLHLLLLTC